MLQRIFVLGSTIYLLSLLSSCSTARIIARGDRLFEKGEYASAAEVYEGVLEKMKEDKAKTGEVCFKTGECYRNINDSRHAEKFYKKAIKQKYKKPIVVLRLADQMRKNGEYDEASLQYEELRRLDPEEKRADFGLEGCDLARKWLEKPSRYELAPMKQFNTKENEFCPVYLKGDFSRVAYTSTSTKGSKQNPLSGMKFTDFWETRRDRKGDWDFPAKITDSVLCTEWDDGAASISSDFNTLYFTSCRKEPGKRRGCQIFESRSRSGEWTKPKALTIVHDSISVGHPSISADGLDLYFSARMKGGFGGADIWVVHRESPTGSWGKPKNLGSSINSPGDEMFPFIRQDGILYFSSDYWAGMGGLDIFKAQQDADGFWQIYNMRAPINSSQDDFGIIFQGAKEIGLLSSTRKEGKGGEDIFSFELPELEFWVQGKITDKSSRRPIVEAPVKLFGSDGTVTETTSRTDGTYKFKLKQYVDYIVLGAAADYLKKKVKISTYNLDENKTFTENIELITTSKPVEIPNIFYDFGKAELNEKSKAALIELAQLLEDNPNITIELGAHTDMVGDSLKNMDLSNRRATAVIEYLKQKGYDPDRLIAKGFGERCPVVLNDVNAAFDTAFHVGDTLNEHYILALPTKEQQDKANQINRRTELRVLSSNYIPKPEYFEEIRRKRFAKK